ncbi:MAG: hypothetical protein ACR2LK_16975 [Solirubrobacteraceae bacterium]
MDACSRREAYRTALDEGRRDATLQRRYQSALVAYQRARRRRAAASREPAAARPAADSARSELRAARTRVDSRRDAQRRRDSRVSVALRLALLLTWLGASYLVLGRLRRRGSRWLPATMAAVAAVALLALVMAVDYLTDYIDVTDVGVLVLAVAGALMTIVAFAALQRYLARRLPERRVRHRECPFCGFPVREQSHCEGCGRDVVGACSTCHEPRRVGTRHCRACGAA